MSVTDDGRPGETFGATLPDLRAAERTSSPLGGTTPDARYAIGRTLGRGGMGEVRLAHDERIDREVAIKLLRDDQAYGADLIARFVREARLQGQLEHPAVVPVHDLGTDPDGKPYFVMKRLKGTTLAEVLATNATDAVARERWPRRILLARFVDVCLAIELAHTRGVVHRDLKPANIMLGDFGEVYVLDWGLARVTGELSQRFGRLERNANGEDSGGTLAGELLGTPGYMAPEQIRGEAVDVRADVYALGCVLYEILTGRPPVPRGMAALEPALDAVELRPSVLCPEVDVPVELDELCARATASDREKRPSARTVADLIQAYLDGDRDLETRRALARKHSDAAASESCDTEASRARAMREAGRALALDPANREAGEIVSRLMLEAPATLPVAAETEAEEAQGRTYRVIMRSSLLDFVGFLLLMPVFLLIPVKHVWPIALLVVLTAANAAGAYVLSRRKLPMNGPGPLILLAINTGVLATGGIVLGPLLLMPVLVCASIVTFTIQPVRHSAWLVSHLVALFGPLALEWFGVLPMTYRFDSAGMHLEPWAVGVPATAGLVVFLLAVTVQIISEFFVVLNLRRSHEGAQRRLFAQSWHLRQLVPTRRGTDAARD